MKVNLVGEIAKRKILISDIAEYIGVHRNTVTNKIYGKQDFTLSEAFAIADHYFPDCDFRWLFAVSE